MCSRNPVPILPIPSQGAHRCLRSHSILVSFWVRDVSSGWFSMMLEGNRAAGGDQAPILGSPLPEQGEQP